MAVNPFRPRFIQESELTVYSLPTASQQSDVMALVERASVMLDEHCARTDVDGNGSLVYTTYTERLHLPPGRNIVRLSFRPLVALDATTVSNLAASGQLVGVPNFFYTGVQANTISHANVLSPLLSASGRFGYARRGQQQVYPDMGYAANVLQIAAFFGGPPGFTPIDITQVDFDPKTTEIWIPAGLYTSQYTEIVVTYNSGFNPFRMPNAIKDATAFLVRNMLSRGGGASGLRGFQAGRISAQFTEHLIDENIQKMVQAYRTVRIV